MKGNERKEKVVDEGEDDDEAELEYSVKRLFVLSINREETAGKPYSSPERGRGSLIGSKCEGFRMKKPIRE
jgi:hypothetical protein